MVPEDPQVARLGGRCIRRRRHVVGIAKAFLKFGVEQFGQLVRVEAQQAEVEVARLQVGQLDRQQVVVPIGQRGSLVVGDAICFDLLGRQVPDHMDRHLLQA